MLITACKLVTSSVPQRCLVTDASDGRQCWYRLLKGLLASTAGAPSYASPSEALDSAAHERVIMGTSWEAQHDGLLLGIVSAWQQDGCGECLYHASARMLLKLPGMAHSTTKQQQQIRTFEKHVQPQRHAKVASGKRKNNTTAQTMDKGTKS